ncbi:MAG: hypothetical protein IKT58_01010, partial [Oscillospiraceae bacterium]|nr:hypothetical protein [Oscillospiraceae bacterium]
APTCTETGLTEGKHCATCSVVLTAQEVLPATGHSEVTDSAVAPTCTENGLTEGKHCATCSAVLTAQEVVPATGHSEVTDSAVAPTCTATGLTEGKHCSTCSAVLTAQEVVPATGHSYVYTSIDRENHKIGCESCDLAELAPHSYVDGLCICGEQEAKDPVLDASLKINHSLNLASDISVNYVVYKYLLADFDLDSIYMECVLPVYQGSELVGTSTVRIRPVDQGYLYYFTLEGLTAVKMNDRISAVLHGVKDGQEIYSPTDDYSIADYAYAQLAKDNVALKLKSLCADLLRYGSAAQLYKGYRVDFLADNAMTDAQRDYLSDIETVDFGSLNQTMDDLENPQITWAGKTLSLESKVILRYVINLGNFSGNLEDLSLHLSYTDRNGNPCTAVLTELVEYSAALKLYAFDFDGLLAAELRSSISAQVYVGDEPASVTMKYSPDTYGNGKTGLLGDLCKALFAYSDSAKNYFLN